MSIICEEVFDEISHPSEEEIKDYATKIGIDPDSEPQLLPLAAEGLMKALPSGWKPCYDDKSKSYYYYNNATKKTQWEHPLDEVYRGLVKKARAESQSASIHDNRDDATCVTDDLLSLDEPPKMLDPFPIVGTKRKDVRLSPLKLSPAASPKKESRLFKQMSEDVNLKGAKKSLGFSSFDNEKDISFDKHPRSMDKPELKLTGGGSMFLKSNTKKSTTLEQQSSLGVTSNLGKSDSFQESQQPKGILREKLAMEHSKSVEFDKLSTLDKSEREDDDRKSVRFNLDNNTDIGITFSDKSSSEDELNSNKNIKADEIINVKVTPNKSRFTVVPVSETNSSLKLVKPNPSDFVKPKLTLNTGSDSDEETRSLEKVAINNVDSIFDSDNSASSHEEKLGPVIRSKLVHKSDKAVEKMKQKIWEEKNDELVKFKEGLESSHKSEIGRILDDEKSKYEETLKTEIDDLKTTMKEKHKTVLEEEEKRLEAELVKLKAELEAKYEMEEKRMKEDFETKKDEIEKYYEEKLAEVEKELADRVDRTKSELTFTHNANVDQLKQNHSILIDDLKRGFKTEEQILKKEHQAQLADLKARNQNEIEQEKNKCDEKTYEKLRCEKRLLEDKYRCLKDKYLRLKTDVKLSIEKRNKKKEQSITTNTTGSETEQSNSNNKDRKLIDKPPTPKQNRSGVDAAHLKSSEGRHLKQVIIQDLDTSVSDNCYQSDDKANQNDSSDSTNPGKNKRKLFSRLKSSSTSRINNNAKSKKPQRACSPVENLRKQLQKLEDLEDQFPENSHSDTYHLRYPFSDGHKFEGSSELEFFRHRIHLERDSIKRAKESLRSQKTLFQQRQKELKLKHGSMARHTLQQLCQEEKELTDMEVNLHRTRSLLGEKVIRLRHLEQSLQRANIQSEQKGEDATLSDISSHSASSGISSTEFAAGEFARGCEKYQESSEIMQSLENLNSEIREIWDVLRTQQQQNNIAKVSIPPLAVYPDLGWPMLAAASSSSAGVTAPHSIPTLADRLHTYRQQVAVLANAQSTMVTAAGAGGEQAVTTHLVERTRNLKHWLRQTTAAATAGEAAGSQEAAHNKPPQTTL